MAAPGAEHPHPDHLLTFVAKMVRELPDARDYVRRTAAMVRREYPASAGKLLPELRKLFKEAERNSRV